MTTATAPASDAHERTLPVYVRSLAKVVYFPIQQDRQCVCGEPGCLHGAAGKLPSLARRRQACHRYAMKQRRRHVLDSALCHYRTAHVFCGGQCGGLFRTRDARAFRGRADRREAEFTGRRNLLYAAVQQDCRKLLSRLLGERMAIRRSMVDSPTSIRRERSRSTSPATTRRWMPCLGWPVRTRLREVKTSARFSRAPRRRSARAAALPPMREGTRFLPVSQDARR